MLLRQHHPEHEGVEMFSFALILSRRKTLKGKGSRAVKASGGITVCPS